MKERKTKNNNKKKPNKQTNKTIKCILGTTVHLMQIHIFTMSMQLIGMPLQCSVVVYMK